MNVSDFISMCRREFNDLPEAHRDVKTGDGVALLYKTKFSPIKEGTFKLYIGGTLKTVTTDYSIDYDTGDITLVSVTSAEIRAEYSSVKFRDQHYLEYIQSSLDEMGDKFWKRVVGSPAIHLSAGVYVYNCPSGCLNVTKVRQSDNNTSAGNFVPMSVNVRYDKIANQLVLGLKPTRANYLALDYCKRISKPTATSGTLDVRDEWTAGLKMKVGSISHRSLASKIAQQGNASVEEGHWSTASLRQLANDFEIKYENWEKKCKPVMPATELPYHIPNGGQP